MAKDLISAYLGRIKYVGKTDVSYETLHGLHIAHTMNVPFENLDVYYGKPILLDRESLFKKIVEDKRGGYCFEMNGLFSIILKELGFKVTDLLARVSMGGEVFLEKNHQVLIVQIKGKRWLVDVGFGRNGITAPLLLKEGIEQEQFNQTFRLVKHPKFGYVLQNKTDDEYQDMYAFTLEECFPRDYFLSNYFVSTFPDSFFVKTKFCTIPTEFGRLTLTEEHFKETSNGQISERYVADDAEFNELLKKYFDLDLEFIV